MKEKQVLIGNGMADVRTQKELIKLEPEIYSTSVFGEEPYGNYSQIIFRMYWPIK